MTALTVAMMPEALKKQFVELGIDLPEKLGNDNPVITYLKSLYPPVRKSECSQVCDGYSCMWCGRCPNGEYFKIPLAFKSVADAYTAWVGSIRDLHDELPFSVNIKEDM